MGMESTSPCAQVKHLTGLLRNRPNSQWYSSIYEDGRPKIVEDFEKSDGETIKPGTVKTPELDPNRGHPNIMRQKDKFHFATAEYFQGVSGEHQ